MPWARLESGFHQHPKIGRLSDGAFRLWVSAISWSTLNLTDGLIEPEVLAWLLPTSKPARRRRLVDELVRTRLWIVTQQNPDGSPDGGWHIRNFERYQPTKQQVIDMRAAAAERKRRERSRRDSGVSHAAPPPPTPNNNPPTPALRAGEQRNSRANGTNPRARQKLERAMNGARNLGIQRARLGIEADEFIKHAEYAYRERAELVAVSVEAFERERTKLASEEPSTKEEP